MKTILFLSLLSLSLSSLAGDRYLSCGFGEEEHWENFTDTLIDQEKALLTLSQGTHLYVITLDHSTFQLTKSNRNLGGFTVDSAVTRESGVTALGDNIFCHIND